LNFKQIEETLKRLPELKKISDIQSFRVDMRKNINEADINYENSRGKKFSSAFPCTELFRDFPRDVTARQFAGHVAATTHLRVKKPLRNALKVSVIPVTDILKSVTFDDDKPLEKNADHLAKHLLSMADSVGLPIKSQRQLSTIFESVLCSSFRLVRIYSSIVGVFKTIISNFDELTMKPVLHHEFTETRNSNNKRRLHIVPDDATVPSKRTRLGHDKQGKIFIMDCE